MDNLLVVSVCAPIKWPILGGCSRRLLCTRLSGALGSLPCLSVALFAHRPSLSIDYNEGSLI